MEQSRNIIEELIFDKTLEEEESYFSGMTAAEKVKFKSLENERRTITDKLQGTLTKEQRELFFEYDDVETSYWVMIEEHMYKMGFKLARELEKGLIKVY